MIDARETELLEQIARLEQENRWLQQKLKALARRIFGKKSEQLDPQQLQLLFQELEAPGPAMGKPFGPQNSETDLVSAVWLTPLAAAGALAGARRSHRARGGQSLSASLAAD